MLLNESLLNQTVNGYSGLDHSGFLGVGRFNNSVLYGIKRPYSMLHLDDNGYSWFAYRPWMRAGMLITQSSDQCYFGLKYEGGASTSTVLSWSDNNIGDTGPDALRIIFVGPSNGSDTAASTDGLEAARFLAAASGNQSFFGLGDWKTAGVNPNQRLDLLNGRLRIRQLPNEPEAPALTKFLVVEDTPGSTKGVVRWRYLPQPPLNCDWTLNPTTQNNVSTAFGPADPDCPDIGDAVGIGVDLGAAAASAKFNLTSANFPTAQAVEATMPTGVLRGVKVRTTGGSDREIGYQASVEGSGTYLEKIGFLAHVENAPVYRTRGVMCFTNGATYTAYAGFFASNDSAQYSHGVQGLSRDGDVRSIGVAGRSYGRANVNAGVVGYHGIDSASIYIPAGNYGVIGMTAGSEPSTDWAGWFEGDVMVNGTGVIPGGVWQSSDVNLKENIEDLTNASAVIGQLEPKSFDYLTDQYPQLGLPTGEQYGFIAQELRQVIPEAVRSVTIHAVLDSTGSEVQPALPTLVINQSTIIPFLVAAFQEQTARISSLEAQLAQCCASDQGTAPQGYKVEPDDPAGDLQEQRLLIIPNPVADITTLEYYVPQAGRVSLSVSTSDGKPLGTLREEQAEPGAYSYPWNTTKLAAGTYFCTYTLDGQVVVKRAVKVGR